MYFVQSVIFYVAEGFGRSIYWIELDLIDFIPVIVYLKL